MYAGSRGGSRPAYSVDELVRLLSVVDSSGHPRQWLSTGVVFLHIFAPSGHLFATWVSGTRADGADWSVYLDSLFASAGALRRLDSAVAIVEAAVSPLAGALPVAVMIPYPDPRADSLGFGGLTFDITRPQGRIAAAAAYVAEVGRRFPSAHFHRLRLDGFYWLFESIPADDTTLVSGVASAVHQAGARLLWIPFFTAQNVDRWQALGIDEAWLQPNYFFNRDVPATRLDSAAARALRLGMGLEIEFDGRLYNDARFGDRLDPYLATLATVPALRARSTALYEGGGALIHLSHSRRPSDVELYRRLAEVLR
ncbi:MAG TPA: DUF4855 domain-containing protein [Dehalococcoidia bacterium]|nr:DUF4855 domain-containing protein [Dehalococcoidia bacterium]